ncbi:hypothetical protein C8Q74DRAFT_682144 [Fomes fomentarius]|nr:hypothetical protein C8Q74DRAFT_682144 [Fomes fomentarius]
MQSYSHPDVFFCPLYNQPGMADPKTNLCGGSENDSMLWDSSDSGSQTSSPSTSASSSRSTSFSPPSSPGSDASSRGSDREKRVGKYKRMSAKAGKSLLDFATEIESRRIVCEKRKQVKDSQSCRNSPERPQSA